MSKKKFAFKADNGKFVCAEGGGGREIVSNREKRDIWETFNVIFHGQGKVSLQTHSGHLVCAENAGGTTVIANRSKQDIWETFTLIKIYPANKVAFLCFDGEHYLCAEDGGNGRLNATRDKIGPWETFEMIDVSQNIQKEEEDKEEKVDEGRIHHVRSKEEYLKLKSTKNNKLVVIDYFATWCGPCRAIAPFFKELSQKYPNIVFVKVQEDECVEIIRDENIQCYPTFL